MNSLYSIATLTIAIAIYFYLSKVKNFFPHLSILLAIFFSSYTVDFPAVAALSIKELDLPQRQEILEEDLKLAPDGTHYRGVESTKIIPTAEDRISDTTIQENIESYLGDDVVVAVVDGSVRLAGTVKDRATARELVAKTKAILGVREVTYNFGIENSQSN